MQETIIAIKFWGCFLVLWYALLFAIGFSSWRQTKRMEKEVNAEIERSKNRW